MICIRENLFEKRFSHFPKTFNLLEKATQSSSFQSHSDVDFEFEERILLSSLPQTLLRTHVLTTVMNQILFTPKIKVFEGVETFFKKFPRKK